MQQDAVLEGMHRRQSWAILWYVLAVLAGIAIAGLAMWQVPWWIDAHYLNGDLKQPVATTVTGVRTSLLAIGAGGLAAVGILYTHRTLQHTRENDERQADLTREDQLTDRYIRAVSQIASDKPVEQLGGIYALERIMRDSEKDHVTIVEVLAAFVREHAPAPFRADRIGALQRFGRAAFWKGIALRRPPDAVQAALRVLGRRPNREEPNPLDLSHTDLRGADLREARLQRANLQGAHLQMALLFHTRLERADLQHAHMEGAGLWQAHLEGADLTMTHLQHANLTETHLEETQMFGIQLSGASLLGAHLDRAYLANADLREVEELSVEQVVAAWPTIETKLPKELAGDSHVRARVTEVHRWLEGGGIPEHLVYR
ncbi:pentapeptide repeat-containing protein [Streptomyces sp. NPDC088253]|uniref:pentapeptide repeat-containing protein n=1 Tax=Streptomyces sp. NPDC088253 TaxID=3365846 RepID=UPI00382EC648